MSQITKQIRKGVRKMKKLLIGVVSAAAGLAILTAPVFAATCYPTTFFRDGFYLTAAQIGGDVTGTLDATGCNIGIYYNSSSGNVTTGAEIFGANYFGVVVDGASVNVSNSSVHNIGENPFNGTQHGVDVYYTNGASGTIDSNTVTKYQKGGIVVNGIGTSATVTNNTVIGLGPVDFIAQNGIQVSRGAGGVVRGNSVSGNFYTGTVGVGPNPGGQNPPGWEYTSGGILLYQAGDVQVAQNKLSGNQRNMEVVP